MTSRLVELNTGIWRKRLNNLCKLYTRNAITKIQSRNTILKNLCMTEYIYLIKFSFTIYIRYSRKIFWYLSTLFTIAIQDWRKFFDILWLTFFGTDSLLTQLFSPITCHEIYFISLKLFQYPQLVRDNYVSIYTTKSIKSDQPLFPYTYLLILRHNLKTMFYRLTNVLSWIRSRTLV